MNIFGDTTIGTVTQWLHGLSQRQDAISQNIANIDTPGYQRRDASFEVALAREIGTVTGGLATTDPRHIPASTSMGGLGIDQAQLLTSSRMDANNVDIDQEMVDLAETQLRYQAAASALSTRLGSIRNVISNT